MGLMGSQVRKCPSGLVMVGLNNDLISVEPYNVCLLKWGGNATLILQIPSGGSASLVFAQKAILVLLFP